MGLYVILEFYSYIDYDEVEVKKSKLFQKMFLRVVFLDNFKIY